MLMSVNTIEMLVPELLTLAHVVGAEVTYLSVYEQN